MGPHDLDGVARKCSKSLGAGRYLLIATIC